MKKALTSLAMSLLWVVPFAACGERGADEAITDESITDESITDGTGEEDTAVAQDAVKNADFHVFVIAMENHDAGQIFGNTASAPYINGTLLPKGTKATSFIDTLPSHPSEPHYIVMEAGTNSFADKTFNNNNEPSAANSTSSTAHLVTQLNNNGLSWMSYQEGMTQGTCPVSSQGNYAAKHNPFVFFKDVAGSPPSASNTYCKNHHRPYSQLAADLTNAGAAMANYVFITPNLIHDMHDACPAHPSDAIRCGDDWLKTAVPPILQYLTSHKGALFIVWDEGENAPQIPFIALGPTIKSNYESKVVYSHGSLVKSVERIFGLGIVGPAKNSNDFRDLFKSDAGDPLGVAGLGDECPSDPKKVQPGVCGCGKKERSNTSGYVDGQGYACNDWIGYDCKQAKEQEGYTQAQEDALLANCSLSCGVCL